MPWAAIIAFGLKYLPTVLGWFGVKAAPDPATAERQDGERLGVAETKASNNERAINEVTQAIKAGEDQRAADAVDPSRLRDPANLGARPYRPGPD